MHLAAAREKPDASEYLSMTVTAFPPAYRTGAVVTGRTHSGISLAFGIDALSFGRAPRIFRKCRQGVGVPVPGLPIHRIWRDARAARDWVSMPAATSSTARRVLIAD